ncbi:MAG: hypothetical protein QOC56_1728 [Alphaproteobacteria bacterium]|nr:hypothetical protein [Alphaproteobacteria bacterium]
MKNPHDVDEFRVSSVKDDPRHDRKAANGGSNFGPFASHLRMVCNEAADPFDFVKNSIRCVSVALGNV